MPPTFCLHTPIGRVQREKTTRKLGLQGPFLLLLMSLMGWGREERDTQEEEEEEREGRKKNKK